MAAEQLTTFSEAEKSVATCAPATPQARVFCTVTTDIELDRVFIGDVSEGQVADEPTLPRLLTIRSPRHQRDRDDGLVELRIGEHAYVLSEQALLGAIYNAVNLVTG